MKTKLLKKLRNQGRNKVNIYSITRTNNCITGMSYGFDEPEYRGLFSLGDTAQIVKEKACRIYMNSKIEYFRNRYKRHSVKYGL